MTAKHLENQICRKIMALLQQRINRPARDKRQDVRVAGHGCSIREWALRQGWGGRAVRVEQAQGILVAALGVLAGTYGYQRRFVGAKL
jgi:hypothetical protein